MPKSKKKKKTVLIVDDAAYTRRMLKNIVNGTTYAEVIGEASDGQEAIDLYKKLKPDLITMDIVMAKKNGIEAIRELKKINDKALIVVVSALGQETVIFEAIKLGAKDYIKKPFKKGELLQVLKKILVG